MTSSGTTTFGIDTEQLDIVTEAYERCGIAPDLLTAHDLDSARRSLNFLFSDWSNNEINLWKIEMSTQALVAGTNSYALDANLIYIVNAAIRVNDGVTTTDYPITAISRAEWLAQPSKTTQAARPSQFYLERTATPTVYLWPVPQDATCTLVYYGMRVMDDAGTFLQTPDAPQRWMEAIASGLAAKLAVKKAPDRVDLLKGEAGIAFDKAYSADRERVPLRISIGRR